MYICYIDEAGCLSPLPTPTSPIQPVFVISGITIRANRVRQFTHDFLAIKKRYFPRIGPTDPRHQLGWILAEIKGADVRRAVASSSRNERRHAFGYLDRTLDLLERHDCRIKGRIWVKGIGQPFNGRAVYTSSIQYIHQWLNAWLEHQDSQGMVICDSRNKQLNSTVSFSVFTEKFHGAGDRHSRVIELPTFGHSENHAGVQVADTVCSALLFPMAIATCCEGHVSNLHVRKGYDVLLQRYSRRLGALQHRIIDVGATPPRPRGGIAISDPIGKKGWRQLFKA